MARYLPSPVMPLADYRIDRAAEKRSDPAWLAAAQQDEATRVCLLRAGELLAAPDGVPARPGATGGGARASALVWLGPQALALAHRRALFLGLAEGGGPVFALDIEPAGSRPDAPDAVLAGLGEWMDLRGAVQGMGAFDAGVAATARSLFEWHERHGYCSRCGSDSAAQEAGWKRVCTACGTEHFPRTDPVAIMLVVHGERTLLGRQARWPQGFWSCLAGFIEPGESIEQGAVRELKEEAGVIADPDNAVYLFSQPWPFPSSLMIALTIEAETEEIAEHPSEIEAARWFTREEIAAMLDGRHEEYFCPPPSAIAHHMLRAWLQT